MNGFFSKALLAGACAAGLLGGSGCYYRDYWDLVDPCWPAHYNCETRAEVMIPRVTQATNGLVLEQTVWNYHFREGTADLLPAGQLLLDRVARRRPMPVGDIFVQTAHDVDYDVAHPEQMVMKRADLDAKRMKAVETYLAAARPDVSFSLAVHDPSRVSQTGVEAQTSTYIHYRNATGSRTGNLGQDITQLQQGGGGVGGQVGPAGPTTTSGTTGGGGAAGAGGPAPAPMGGIQY